MDNVEWTSLRIRRDTLNRLRAFARSVMRGRSIGLLDDTGQVRQGVLNMDTALSLLLDRQEAHQRRGRRSKKG